MSEAATAKRQTGPILITTGEFELLTTKDFGPALGPIVIRARSASWLVAALAVVGGIVACALLAIDRSEKVDDSERAHYAYAATETELTTAKSELAALTPILQDLQTDRSTLRAVEAKQAAAESKATALEAAMKTELKREIGNGDARVSRRAAKVAVTFENWAIFDDGDVGARGADLLVRAGSILAKDDGKIRVEAHSDDSVDKHFASTWDMTAVQAATVVRFLEDAVEIPANRLEAVGRGATEQISKSRAKNRRVELVVDYAR